MNTTTRTSKRTGEAGCGRASRRTAGIALLLVLWAVMILSIAVITSARLVELDIDSRAQENRRFEARQNALTGLNIALNDRVKRGDPLLFQKTGPNTSFQVRFISEGARINVNKLLARRDARRLRELFIFWGVDPNGASVVVDSLKDWADRDTLRSLNGAEAQDIPPDSGYSVPQNRPFYSIEEVAHVRGMERVAARKPDWRMYFSVFSTGKLDLQDAPADLLRVFGGLSADQASLLIRYRNGSDDLPFTTDDILIKSLDEVASIIPLSAVQEQLFAEYFDIANNPYRITSIGRTGGTRYEISAVVAARGKPLDATLLQWEER